MTSEVYNQNIGKIQLIPLNHKSEEDYNIFKEIFCDIDIMRTSSMFNGKISNNEKELKKYFLITAKSNETHNTGFYKLVNQHKKIIGISGLILIEENRNHDVKILEIGYFIKNKYHNKKIGGDIAKFLVHFAFKKFKSLDKIIGTTLENNIPSQIIMLKLGFDYLGKKLKRNSVINYYELKRSHLENNNYKNNKILEERILNFNKQELIKIDKANPNLI